MEQINDGLIKATSDEQEKRQESWNQQFEFVQCNGFDNSDTIKVEIKQEELNTSCVCGEYGLHKCDKNVNALSYNPLVDVCNMKSEFHESAQDLSIKSPERSSDASSCSGSQLDTTKDSEVKPLLCPVCEKAFSCLSSLRDHLPLHDSSKPPNTKSPGKVKHVGAKLHTCSTCHKEFTHAGNLQAHMRSHTGEKPFACTECNHKCARLSHLRVHMLTHTEEKPFSCTECDYKCAQSSYLKVHMRTHTREKPFACSQCDYKAALSSYLRVHMRTHTGEKPFACSNCQYKCAQAFALRIHMRTHTGEKPFACTDCSYKSTNSSRLSEHMRTHTEEKNFACTKCNYKCAQSSNLKVHVLRHTEEKTDDPH